ncbi:hypothetical protein JL722_9445 [Aureococcus anophagefferens]|nr:hypothetical protein JL722_9445 [Aureococcus anophagefferens]
MHVIIRATVLSCAFTFATAAGGVKLNKKAYPVEAVAVVAIFKDFHPTASEADLAGIALALKGLEASDTSPEAAGGVKLNKKAYPVEAVVAIFKDFHPTASEADLAGIALALKGLEASDTSPEAVPSDDAEDADVDGLPGVEDSARHLSEACADSTTWHKKGDDEKNCAWVGKKKAKRCTGKVKSEGGVLASVACPVACDTCLATCVEGPSCADSTTWHQGWKKSKTCAWVGKSPAKRCDKESKSKVTEDLQETCDAAEDEIIALEANLEEAVANKTEAEGEVAALEAANAKLTAELKEAVADKTEAQGNVTTLEAKIAALEAAKASGRRGDDIDGEAAYDYSGVSVSLSADGTALAVGASGTAAPAPRGPRARVCVGLRRRDVGSARRRHRRRGGVRLLGRLGVAERGRHGAGRRGVRERRRRLHAGRGVFAWDSDDETWKQRGDDIDGEAADDYSGYSVSLSADGTALAVGAPYNDGGGTDAGHARVFAWDSDDETWIQRGVDIDGEAANDYSGYSVSLSADGTALAVGAHYNDGGGTDAGHARVFAWDPVDETWKQRGGDIDGEAADDLSGWSVSLSADGTMLAVGASGNDGAGSNAGHARVFAWDPVDETWKQRGDDIDGEAAGDESGRSVSLSADGATLAVGAVYNDGAGSSAGHARVFAWDSNDDTWIQRGDDIDGEAAYDQSGYSVSLSADGTALAVGASGNDGAGSNAGHARVFDLSSALGDAPRLRAALGGRGHRGPLKPHRAPGLEGRVRPCCRGPHVPGAELGS